MRILTSSLLIVLLSCCINSHAYWSDESSNESDSDEVPKSTVKSTTTSTTTTTVAPVPEVSIEVEKLINTVSDRFDELQTYLSKSHQYIHDKVQNDIENYKLLRDTSIKKFKDLYDYELSESTNQIKSLEAKKSEIEKSIEKVYDNSWIKEENSKKLENLKKHREDIKSGNCDDCEQIEVELQKNDKEIAELEEKIQKQGNVSEIRSLNDDESRQLNEKYSELIQVYQKEIEEHEKKQKLEVINSITKDKWRNYVEQIENLRAKVEERMDKLTKNSLRMNKLTSKKKSYDFEDHSSKDFKWIPFNKDAAIPSNAVQGGIDADGSKLYIVRSKSRSPHLYGKIVARATRRESYVTNYKSEIEENNIELLTSKNYLWCDAKTFKIQKDTPIVCQTGHNYVSTWDYETKRLRIPGTLLSDGRCRVGFEWKNHFYADNVKVLGFGSCDNAKNVADLKFWF